MANIIMFMTFTYLYVTEEGSISLYPIKLWLIFLMKVVLELYIHKQGTFQNLLLDHSDIFL